MLNNIRADGTEERTPASECENDSSSSKKHMRRVSWNVIENDEIVSPDSHAEPCPSRDDSDGRRCQHPELLESAPKKSSTLQPITAVPPSTIETDQTESRPIENNTSSDSERPAENTTSFNIPQQTNINSDSETPVENTTSCNTPQQTAATQDGSTTSMDPQHCNTHQSRFVTDDAAPEYPEDGDDALAVQQSLQSRIARLKQSVLSLKKRDAIQRGNYLVRESHLRTELEGLYEDVLFLGDKRDRLQQNLWDLHGKNGECLESDRNGHKDEAEKKDDKPIKWGTDVSDASVQTDDWSTDYSVR